MASGQHYAAAFARLDASACVVHDCRGSAGIAQRQHTAVERTEHAAVADECRRCIEERVRATRLDASEVGGVDVEHSARIRERRDGLARADLQPCAVGGAEDAHLRALAVHGAADAIECRIAFDPQRARAGNEVRGVSQVERAVIHHLAS